MGWDWNKIKTEYISEKTSSYRKLAKKYNVPISTLQQHATKEGWSDQKKQLQAEIVAKIIEINAEKKINRMTRINEVTDKLLNQIEKAIDLITIEATKDDDGKTIVLIDAKGIKQLSSAIKDIKETQGCKTELEKREQEARIRNMEKADENNDKEIVIRVADGNASAYSE